jgi:hypothetical protein
MKSNFKINDIDQSVDQNPSDSTLDDESKDTNFDDVINSLPKGWNLWSMRNSSN